jgi:hypothetical protein
MLVLAQKRQDFVQIFCCWKTVLYKARTEPKLFQSRNLARKRRNIERVCSTLDMSISPSTVCLLLLHKIGTRKNKFCVEKGFLRLLINFWASVTVNLTIFSAHFYFSCSVFRKLLLLSKMGPLPIAWNRRKKQFPPLHLHLYRTNAPSSCCLVTWVR